MLSSKKSKNEGLLWFKRPQHAVESLNSVFFHYAVAQDPKGIIHLVSGSFLAVSIKKNAIFLNFG